MTAMETSGEFKAPDPSKRPWVGWISVAFIAASVGGCGGSVPNADPDHPAAADVTVSSCAKRSTSGPLAPEVPVVRVKVTNHSSKRSSYIIKGSFDSGSTQVDAFTVLVHDVEPGSTVSGGSMSFKRDAPAGLTCRITDVNRTPA